MFQVVAQAPPPPPPPPGAEAPWMLFDSGQLFLLSLFGIIAAAIVLFPLIRAVARRLEGGGRIGEVEELRVELDRVRQQMDGMATAEQVGELEERLDFAERLLAQQREPARIDGGGAP